MRKANATMSSEDASILHAKELASIIRISPDIVYRLDRDGRILFISDGIKNYGYTPAEVLGRSIIDFIHPEDRELAKNRINERRTGARCTRKLELRFLTKDKESVDLELVGADGNGEKILMFGAEGLYDNDSSDQNVFLGTQGIARDITDRKIAEMDKSRLEKQLIHSQRMEAIGTFAGGIVHDFNNVLSIIMGYTEISALEAGGNAKLLSNMRKVMEACGRARDLSMQILAYNRQYERAKKPIQLAPIIKEICKLLNHILPPSIRIHSHLDKGEGCILADATEVHQILMNLCTNAYSAMLDRSGDLTIALESEVFGQGKTIGRYHLKPGHYAKLTVRDTGHGMNPSIIEKIFEPYFTTKGKGEGTGLGLAIVRQIVESYKGAIFAESRQGVGSAFHVYFRLVKTESTGSKRETASAPAGGCETILLVDDEERIVDISREMLKYLGYTVYASTSTTQALRAFKHRPNGYDLVITDQSMPDMSGQDLAKEIRVIRPDIPIILFTGNGNVEHDDLADATEFAAVLKKPLRIKEMAKALREVLGGKAADNAN